MLLQSKQIAIDKLILDISVHRLYSLYS